MFFYFKEDLVSKSNECRSKYLPNPQQYRMSKSCKRIYNHCFFSFGISGSSFNKIDDDNVSIMAPHQSYFDEYPSGTGKIIIFFCNR
jgi:hypothetical protein